MPQEPSQKLHRERRAHARLAGVVRLSAQLRCRGQIGQIPVRVLDFNRHGLAVRCERPLPKDQVVFLALAHGERVLERVVGVVHNCFSLEGGYRCGIRFRTQSRLQFDRETVESGLAELESALADRA